MRREHGTLLALACPCLARVCSICLAPAAAAGDKKGPSSSSSQDKVQKGGHRIWRRRAD